MTPEVGIFNVGFHVMEYAVKKSDPIRFFQLLAYFMLYAILLFAIDSGIVSLLYGVSKSVFGLIFELLTN